MPYTLPTIQERSSAGRRGVRMPTADLASRQKAVEKLPAALRRRDSAPLPEVSELEAVRHFTRMSQANFAIDGQFYPLGSCTMKYNPKVNEQVAALPGFANLHPLQPDEDCQGTLQVMFRLQEALKTVLGMDEVTLTPAAGAQGEYTGLAMIKAYHRKRGEEAKRRVMLVPDSAHGTNPASAALAGFSVKTVPSNDEGRVDLETLKGMLDDSVAGIMLTNPNTCGVFEKEILDISRAIHDAGGLLYYDGANLNAIVGRVRPADMGFDVVHVNLHKTFSTPHGGGGPGSGAVGAVSRLADFLPNSHVKCSENGTYTMHQEGAAESIGRLMAFHGNTGVLIRALSYILAQGGEGLRDVANYSVLNANYVLAKLPDSYEKPFVRPCKHEALVSVRRWTKENDVKAFDVAKRLLDYGFHAPTIYFPLLVPECLLVEPTETESRETLDRFLLAMTRIAEEAHNDPEALHRSPEELATGRLDDAKAAKELNVCCRWDPEPAAAG